MIDLILIILMIIAAIRGYITGLTRQVSAIVALILAFIIATPLSKTISMYLKQMMEMGDYLYAPLGYLLAFIFIFVGCRIVAAIIDQFFKWASLNVVNNLLGALLSVIKYVLLISLALNILNMVDRGGLLIKEKAKGESTLYSPVLKAAPTLFPFVVKEIDRIKTEVIEKNKPKAENV